MNCPQCGSNNPEGATFCQNCALRLQGADGSTDAPSQYQTHYGLLPQPPRANRTAWLVVTAIVVVAVLIMVAVAGAFTFFTNHNTPSGAVVGWLFDGGFGNSKGMADRTIARVIGGDVYNQTRQWYSDFLAQYKGNTQVSVSTVIVLTDQNTTPAQRALAEDATALLANSYNVAVTEHCYASCYLTGLGHYNQELTVGLLKVGSSWYIGYATDVVDLGNI